MIDLPLFFIDGEDEWAFSLDVLAKMFTEKCKKRGIHGRFKITKEIGILLIREDGTYKICLKGETDDC